MEAGHAQQAELRGGLKGQSHCLEGLIGLRCHYALSESRSIWKRTEASKTGSQPSAARPHGEMAQEKSSVHRVGLYQGRQRNFSWTLESVGCFGKQRAIV